MASAADTFPRLLLQNAGSRGQRPAMREKRHGIWQTLTWQDMANDVAALAAALVARGLERGDHVALIGDNRPRLYVAMSAVHWLGGIAVPLSHDVTTDELEAALRKLDIAHVFAEDQEQVDKLLSVLPRCPGVRTIIYDNERGMRPYLQPQLASFRTLLEQGRASAAQVAAEANRGEAGDAALLLFAGDSGKGAVLSHIELIERARRHAVSDGLHEGDVVVACLPPSWLDQNLFSYAQPLLVGHCVCYPESPDTLLSDMREMGPSYLLAPSSVLKGLQRNANSRMDDAGRLKRRLYRRHMRGDASLFGDWLIHAPLRDVLGMSRIRAAYMAGEAADDETLAFFRAIGIGVRQTEGGRASAAPASQLAATDANDRQALPVTAPRAFPVGDPILELNNISLRFGGVNALTDISFNVREHEVLAIIGPNGAGKSSMLNVINGVYRPQQGNIVFRGRSLTDMTPTRAAHMGISRTFQNIALFKGMSVLDNIMAGRTLKMRASFLEVALQLPRARREESDNRAVVEQIIEFLEIEQVRKTPVARLPYGLQKRVELGRALAAEPDILLLDEPMAGMNIEEKQDMCRFILDVNDHYGTTVVLIEHDMGVVMDISDRVVVLDYGKKIGDGTPEAVRANQDVIDAYLGVAH
nr:AMP-binding protein [Methyloversatilis thermotolerans]